MSAELSRTDPEQKTVVGQHGKSSNTGLLPIKGTFFLPSLVLCQFSKEGGGGHCREGYLFLLFLYILPTLHKHLGSVGCPAITDHIPAPSKRPERRERKKICQDPRDRHSYMVRLYPVPGDQHRQDVCPELLHWDLQGSYCSL